MGSKTRSLGLSSLVVTTLDKGAHEEMTANGWTIPDNPIRTSAPVVGGPNSAVMSEVLKYAVGVSKSSLTNVGVQKPTNDSFQIEIPDKVGTVRKLSNTGWRKKWGKRILSLNRDSLQMSKTDSSKTPYKSIKLRDIVRIEDVRGKENGEDFAFSVVFARPSKENNANDAETWVLAASSEGERNEWRANIAFRALVQEVTKQGALSPASKAVSPRLLHLVSDCGANLEMHVAERTPLLLLAAWCNRKDVMNLLLRRGVDARCLLRLEERLRRTLSPADVMEMLVGTNRDLNLTGDDLAGELSVDSVTTDDQGEGGWSLLHYFVVHRDVEACARLLQRIDRPTLNVHTLGGETALTLAVKRLYEDDDQEQGSKKVREMVKMLLDYGADPNIPCSSGDNAFHIVCKRGAKLPPQLSLLFEASGSLDVNKPDAFGDCPLHLLIKSSQIGVAKRIVTSDPRVNLNLRDCYGDTPLVLAMKTAEESFACLLLAKNADGSAKSTVKEARNPRVKPLKAGNDESEYPIHLAIKMHLTSLALKLIEKLPVEQLTVRDDLGKDALLLSILHSLLGVAHAIVARLDQDAYRGLLNYHDMTTGDTATHLALRAGRVELTNALLDAGVDIGARNTKGETCIHVCARFVERTYNSAGGYSALKLFNKMIEMDAKRGAASCINIPTKLCLEVPPMLKSCAERLARGSHNRVGAQPVIHQAASCENEQCGLWLLEALFRSPVLSMESLDGAQCTPLAVAIAARNAEISKLLLSKCAINRLVGLKRESYLHLTIKQIGYPVPGGEKLLSLVDGLLAHNAYVGYWDSEGNTPLHIACSHEKFLPTLKILLKDHDVLAHRLNDRTESSGLTPLMVAVRKSKSPDIVGAILDAGADHRLMEPKTRYGVFQMCIEPGFDVDPENSAICVRLVQLIHPQQLTEGDDEWRARRLIAEKYAQLINAVDSVQLEVVPVALGSAASPRHKTGIIQKESSSYSLLDNPVLRCNERLALASHHPSKAASLQVRVTKRSLEHKEQDEEGVEKTIGAGGKKKITPRLSSEVDRKPQLQLETSREAAFQGEEAEVASLGYESSGEEDLERDMSSVSTPKLGVCHRLSQLDRIIALEHHRTHALDAARAWLENDNGKKMIAQVANVLMSESDEAMSPEAALELAKRNFLEQHVEESLLEFNTRFPPEPKSIAEDEQ